MSLLDKINESISESEKDNKTNSTKNNELQSQVNKLTKMNEKHIQENKELQSQLDEANRINNKNIEEINELKDLIDNYNSQIDDLKNSYEQNVQNLQARIDFEKEINEKYLSKLVKSNNNLTKDLKEYADKSSENNQELISLLNNDNDESLKELIIKNNDEVTKLLNDNFNEISESIAQNRENHNNTSFKIMDNFDDIPDNQNTEKIDDIKSLISDNKEELNNATNRIINQVSSISEQNVADNIIEKINENIKSTNDELISILNDNSDTTKIEIFNRISDDLTRGNYVNLNAYKKIRELNLFDEVFYKKTYDYSLDIDPLLHFIYKGYEENKKPSEVFNPLEYKESCDKIRESDLNPLVYFVSEGISEGNILINKDITKIKHIDKEDVDKKIDNFTIRGVKKSKRKPKLIVSLTSCPEHIHDLHYTLYSLLNQQLKADKIILWLSETDFSNQELDLPKEVLKLKQNALSIRFCEDLKEYNKIVQAIKTYPNDIIITAYDNIYYPNNWLKILYEDYKKNLNSIIAHKTKLISIQNNNITNYDSWPLNTDDGNSTYHNFPDTAAGVLYPPKAFFEDVCDEDKFMEYPDDMDAWLWAMAILNHMPIKLAKNNLNELTYVNPLREVDLFNNNKSKDDSQDITNDIEDILNKYPEITKIINEEGL